jgi:hypothetical protein
MARDVPGKITVGLAGTPLAAGKKRHLPACTEGPDDDSDSLAVIAQLCCPPRLQHAGSFESASDGNTAGLISEKLSTATSSIADTRPIGIIVPPVREGKLINRLINGTTSPVRPEAP